MRKLTLTRNLLVNDKITAWYQKKVWPSMLPFVLGVSFIQSTLDNSNLQGKSKKGSSYREFELTGVQRK